MILFNLLLESRRSAERSMTPYTSLITRACVSFIKLSSHLCLDLSILGIDEYMGGFKLHFVFGQC